MTALSAPSASALREALARRLSLHTPAGGAVAFVALPSLAGVYLGQLAELFAALGRPLGPTARRSLGDALRERIDEGFGKSPYAFVRVDYATDGDNHDGVGWTIHTVVPEPDAGYTAEGNGGQPPLLEPVADARVLDLAASLGPAQGVACLDVGAGHGRNAIALARRGHTVDAIEPLPRVADALEGRAREAEVDLRVTRGDFWDRASPLPRDSYGLVVCTEIFARLRGLTVVRGLFRRMADVLAPGGAGALPVFVAREGFVPDLRTRELAEALHCPVYPREELEMAAYGLPLQLEIDAPLVEYGRGHTQVAPWPPAPWVEAWASGRHLFDLPDDVTPPVEARWVIVRR